MVKVSSVRDMHHDIHIIDADVYTDGPIEENSREKPTSVFSPENAASRKEEDDALLESQRGSDHIKMRSPGSQKLIGIKKPNDISSISIDVPSNLNLRNTVE